MAKGARRTGLAVAAMVGALVLAACQPLATTSSGTSSAPSSLKVRLAFSDVSGSYGTAQWSFANSGSAAVAARVVAADGGKITSASGRGGSRSIRTPRFDPWSPAPRAAIAVTNAGSSDQLNPGSRTFEFGAEFRLDSPSRSTSSGSIDNGDNLVQRGLWDDRSQFKLEVDGGRPICRIKGRSGEVSITAGMTVSADRWYRASCRRSGETVTLAITSWSTDGTPTTRRWSKTGRTGDMTPSSSSVPLSAGGKLRGSGLHPATDQFNGQIDEVRLTIE